MLVPMAVAFRTGEYLAGYWYAGIAGFGALAGLAALRVHAPQRIRMSEGMIIGCALFVLPPLAMTWPLVAQGIPVLDAYFETVSGITTTGLSTLSTVQNRSTLFLFARSWTQWFGGLGIVALALALVTQPGALARRLSLADSYHEDSLGSTRAHFRSTLTTYCAITVLGVTVLWLVGADWFDALVYALSAVSTGGFAPHDASLAGLGGPPLRIAVVLLCFAGAIPLAVYARAVQGHWRDFVGDPQVKALLLVAPIIAVVLTTSMAVLGGVPLADAAIHGPIMALSAQTTAGFSSLDVGALDGSSKLVMVLVMAVGGAAGSSAGGVKAIRALILLRVLQSMFTRMRLPKHAVHEPRVAGKRVGNEEMSEAVTIVALFAATVLVSWLAFVAAGYDALDSLFEVTSATGTVGLSTGITATELPAALKLVLCGDMLLGRLEFIALFVAVSPRTWLRGQRKVV
jgi:trk system potassium uptake protein TrkH